MKLTSEVVRALRALLDPGEEVCGFIGGIGGTGSVVYPVENLLHSPTSYLMHPGEQHRALGLISAGGLELVGVYHSHPQSSPRLSSDDAFIYPCAQLVLGKDEWRGYVLNYGRVEEIEIVLGD